MLDLFFKGGWVMYAILAASLLAVTIVVERLIFFARIRSDDISLLNTVERAFGEGVAGVLDACGRYRGPVQRVVRASLEQWERGEERMQEAAAFEGNRVMDALERNLGGLSIIAQGAPLLGLLGTVIGMIQAFMRIEQAGGEVDVTSLAGGIWEALLTTAFGLIVAIVALFAFHYFEARVNRYVRLMQEAAERLSALRRSERGR